MPRRPLAAAKLQCKPGLVHPPAQDGNGRAEEPAAGFDFVEPQSVANELVSQS
jgi:hypothetical protein